MLRKLLEKIRIKDSPEESPERVMALATATLLFEVAWADHDISEVELQTLRSVVVEQFNIPDVELDEIVTEARQHHDQSVGLQSFTRTINESWVESQRFELVVNLWKLAGTDSDVHPLEEHMIRKISDLLYLSHGRFIQAKLLARRAVNLGEDQTRL